jgi:predicted transposase/invertase (TIGR01784 family)
MDETKQIMKKEGLKMTLAEKNIEKWVKELGLRERYINDGKKKGKKEDAKRMLAKGYPIEDIIDITGLTKDEILK